MSQRYESDFLSRPLAPGETIQVDANIAWKNARNFGLQIDGSIVNHFTVGTLLWNAPRLSIEVTRKPDSEPSLLMRFGARFTCEVDEAAAQTPNIRDLEKFYGHTPDVMFVPVVGK